MTERNHWTQLSRRYLTRRALLRGSARAGVGAAGLALVGCGGDDDDVQQQAVTQVQQQDQQQQQAIQEQQQQAAQQQQAQQQQAAQQQATQQQQEQRAQQQAQQIEAQEQTQQDQAEQQAAVSRYDKAPVDGGTIVDITAVIFDSADASQSVSSEVLRVLGRIQSKLLRFSNPDSGELAADLASGWEVPDGQTVVLQLREGVSWHAEGPGADHPASTAGRTLTAEDLAWNIERQKSGLLQDGTEGAFGRKGYWSNVASIDIDAGAMTLNLTAPNAAFLQGLANEFNLMGQPELLIDIEPDAVNVSADKVIGTGPYILTEWLPGESISAVRNPDYHSPGPRAHNWVWNQSFEDPTAYRIAFEQKQVDSMLTGGAELLQSIQAENPDSTFLTYKGSAFPIAAYVNPIFEPWNDPRMVKAIDIAIDRRALIQQLAQGLGKASGPVPWVQEAWAIPQEELAEFAAYSLDREAALQEANALWSAAGGAEAGQIDWVNSDAYEATRPGSTEAVAEMFNQAFGTDQFQGVTQSYGEIFPAWFEKTFTTFFSWIPNLTVPDARADLAAAFKTDAAGNYWGISEPDEIDAKLDAATQEFDFEKANALVR
ncbi:MAG: ABC transporter substrate-binding protein, partial [Chloroflexi bacterium]|nr:ABC transporter substrate-binding protein [Chloroflexota bacterium]